MTGEYQPPCSSGFVSDCPMTCCERAGVPTPVYSRSGQSRNTPDPSHGHVGDPQADAPSQQVSRRKPTPRDTAEARRSPRLWPLREHTVPIVCRVLGHRYRPLLTDSFWTPISVCCRRCGARPAAHIGRSEQP